MCNTVVNIERQIKEISSEVLNGSNYSRDSLARNLLNYPAMMVPSVQEPIMKILASYLKEEINLIDPFVGASNTLVNGMKYGMNVFGQDINPLSILISQVKTHIYDIEELRNVETRLLSLIKSDVSEDIEVDFFNIDKWFNKNIQVELSKIRRAICKECDIFIRKFFWVVMAETIRLTSNDRTSTFKMHIRTKEDIQSRSISAIETFITISKRNIESIKSFIDILVSQETIKEGRYIKNTSIVWGNSLLGINTNSKFNLLVTSPPYGDNQTTVTYGQFSYLPLQWIPNEDIDDSIDIDYLKTIQEIDAVSLGGRCRTKINEIETEIFEKSPTLKNFITQFTGKERKKAEKVTRFIYDLDCSIDKIMMKMKNNSFLSWTVGNRCVNKHIVSNDLIINELFTYRGANLITKVERDILSKRMPKRNNFSETMNKEIILIYNI